MRLTTVLGVSIRLTLWTFGRSALSSPVSGAGRGERNSTLDQVPASPTPFAHVGRQSRSGHGDHVMAYWGHTPGTGNTSIADICQEAALDILIVGWVLDFSLPGGSPRFDFGTGCRMFAEDHGPETMEACKRRSDEISLCQALGTKVFVGVGGASSSINFTSRKEAVDAADSLWATFGTDALSEQLQPFSGISFDGFDFDHENGSPDYWDVFARSLRKFFETDRKQFSLSACVSCAGTDPVSPSLYPEMDLVSVRFYNAKACSWEEGSSGFSTSLQGWCNQFVNASNGSCQPPKLYVGLRAFETGGTGWVPPEDLPALYEEAITTAGPCMGGSMLWDGTMALRTKGQDGRTYLSAVKDAMRWNP